MSSNADECKLPLHSRDKKNIRTKYPKRKTCNKNRTNDTDTGKIYDTASSRNTILCNPRDFHRFCKPGGKREKFLCTLFKKEIPIVSCHADDNGACIRKGITNKIPKVAFEETKN